MFIAGHPLMEIVGLKSARRPLYSPADAFPPFPLCHFHYLPHQTVDLCMLWRNIVDQVLIITNARGHQHLAQCDGLLRCTKSLLSNN